jgi:hypothetical protein
MLIGQNLSEDCGDLFSSFQTPGVPGSFSLISFLFSLQPST